MTLIGLAGNSHDWLPLNADCTDMILGNRISGQNELSLLYASGPAVILFESKNIKTAPGYYLIYRSMGKLQSLLPNKLK
jgi:hypothetical protein